MGCNNTSKNKCCSSCKDCSCTTPVRYQGPDIECAGIVTGETIDSVLAKMAQFICDNLTQVD